MPSLAFWRRKTPRNIKRLNGREMDVYLRNHPTVLWRYRANVPGLVLLSVMAASAGGFAVAILFQSHLDSFWDWSSMIGLSAAAAALLGLVSYWSYFAHIAYLATSDRHLLIGRGAKVIAIEWRRLDTRSMGFDAFDEEGNVRGVLDVDVDGYRCKVRLFGRYTVLADLPGFLSTILTKIHDTTEPGES